MAWVSAAFWMNLQKRYELDIARDQAGDALKAIRPLRPKRLSPSRQNELRP
jgi:plasmid maintenance system antidote protein VapI